MTDEIASKACSKCNEVKPLTEYRADRRTKSGKRASCRQCDSKQQKAIREANLEKYRDMGRERSREHYRRKYKGG